MLFQAVMKFLSRLVEFKILVSWGMVHSEGTWQTQKDKRKTKQVTDNIHPDRREIETKNKYTVLSDTDGESEDNDSSNVHQTATVVDPLAKPSGKSLKKRTDKHRSPSRKSNRK
jgi:hypothetical protein